VAAEQGGWLDDHAAAQNLLRVQKQRPKPQRHPFAGTVVRCASALAPEQALLQQQILGNDRLDSARASGVASVTIKCASRPKIYFITCPVYREIINSPSTGCVAGGGVIDIVQLGG
jgi:hypothetical protein